MVIKEGNNIGVIWPIFDLVSVYWKTVLDNYLAVSSIHCCECEAFASDSQQCIENMFWYKYNILILP